MPIISFNDSVTNLLIPFLNNIDEANIEYISNILEIYFNSLKLGELTSKNKKMLTKLNNNILHQENIEDIGISLIYIYIESIKSKLSVKDFETSIKASLNINNINLINIFINFYNTIYDELRTILAKQSFRLPHYKGLNWRLDMVLSSRELHYQTDPCYLLQLETNNNSQIYQCNYTTLNHMVNELEKALNDAKSTHTQRIIKYVN